MIYKSNVEFEDYALNHYIGCSHNCSYCYARKMMHKSVEEWGKPKQKKDVLKEVDKDIKNLKQKIKQVHLCFTTDVFMYQKNEVINLSLEIIKKLINNGIKIKTLTKGEIPFKQIIELEKSNNDLFGEKKINEYGITLTSLDENYRKQFEPGTAPFEVRINSLKQLSENKLFTYVYCEPFNPFFTTINDFEKLLDKIKFVNKIYFGSWQYDERFSDKSKFPEYIDIIKKFCSKNNIELKLKKEISYLAH